LRKKTFLRKKKHFLAEEKFGRKNLWPKKSLAEKICRKKTANWRFKKKCFENLNGSWYVSI